MSTFDLYLIMKLDDIRSACHVMWFFGGILGSVVAVVICVAILDPNSPLKGEVNKKYAILPLLMVAFCWLLGGVSVMLPSTKEAAVMCVAPKIANSEFVNEDLPKEAKELYGLAKQYLKEQVTESEEK